MIQLPAEFEERMKQLLGGEYCRFAESYEKERAQGLRMNRLKGEREDFLRQFADFGLRPVPWAADGFYYDGEARPGKSPYHEAGAYYIQEPSAMSVVSLLDPRPGERVLDLCAAPGGKTSHAASLLGGTGLLVSNEIHPARARILSQNVERMGCRETAVTSASPAELIPYFPEYFDCMIVDAPCSGEGMFRRDPAAVSQWTPESPAACAQRQRAILDSAALAVKEGGVLTYSTCTFAKEENEDNVEWFLAAHPEFELVPLELPFGRPGVNGLPVRRIYPMDGGEGHFVAKFRRVGENPCYAGGFVGTLPPREVGEARQLFEELFTVPFPEEVARFGDRLLLLPPGLPELSGLGVLRAGVEFARQKGRRLEPSHAVFQAARKEECRQSMDLPWDAPALAAFLHGEEIDCDGKGYVAVCAGGVPTGFGKASGGRLKNHYPKGLRLLS